MIDFEKDLVSIITPNYNCEKFISKTIDSVLKQSYSNWEMIIVDDCSNDQSYNIACMYAEKDSRIKVLKNEMNSGAAFSRNRALDVAKGEYIAFLDSDDLWCDTKLEKQIDFMKKNYCDFSFSKYELIDEKDNSLHKTSKVINNLTYWKYLHHCYTGCLTVIYKKEIASDVRSFLIKNNNDYGLFLQVVKKAKKAMGIQEVLAFYRIQKSGISRKKLSKVKPYFELMHTYLHIPYLLSCFYLMCNIIIGKLWKYE